MKICQNCAHADGLCVLGSSWQFFPMDHNLTNFSIGITANWQQALGVAWSGWLNAKGGCKLFWILQFYIGIKNNNKNIQVDCLRKIFASCFDINILAERSFCALKSRWGGWSGLLFVLANVGVESGTDGQMLRWGGVEVCWCPCGLAGWQTSCGLMTWNPEQVWSTFAFISPLNIWIKGNV